MPYRRQFIAVLVSVFCVAILLPSLLVIYVDTFQIYHKPFIPGMALSGNQRFQNAGLINSYLADPASGFDSIVVGTSMSANVSSDKIRQSLGWNKTIRLFLKGGSSVETRKVIEKALATGHVKHLLWEINPWFQLEQYQPTDEDGQFPDYLYNKNPLDDVFYIFNIDTFRLSLALLRGDLSSNDRSFDNMGMSMYEEYKHDTFNANFREALAKGLHWDTVIQKWPDAKRREASYPLLVSNVFPVLDAICNRDIDVVLYIPPVSRLYYAEQGSSAEPVIYMPRQILERIKGCHNMRLHAFDLMAFTGDLNHYRDFMHYTAPASDRLLDMIARQEHVLDLAKIPLYEDQWVDMINSHAMVTTYPAPPGSIEK